MKNLLILIIFFPLLTNAQITFNLECEKGIQKMDTLLMESNEILYKVVQVKKLYSKGKTDYYDGTIILTDKSESLSELELKNVINKIAGEYKVDELIAFKNCDAIRIFYQAMELSNSQKEYLKDNLIGIFKIE